MISVLLLQRIAQLFIFMAVGWVLVKVRLMKPEDSRHLSVLVMYVASPCAIFGSFQVLNTPERLRGLLLALLSALIIHFLFFILLFAFRRPLKLNSVDQASVFYPNAGSLAIPVISGVLGREYVLYTCAFVIVQQVLLWSIGRSMISGERSVSVKKMLLNPNVLAALAGLALFLAGIRIPSLLNEAVNSLGGLLGPLSMMVAGMLIAGMDLRKCFCSLSVLKTSLLRLLVFPFAAASLLKIGRFADMFADGKMILTVSLLSAAGPSAALVISMTQAYGKDPGRASAIHAVTTVLCIITIPAVILYYGGI